MKHLQNIIPLIVLVLGIFLFNSCNSKMGLVWADEFDYTGLPNSEKWSYDFGDGCPQVCGWGNGEAQFYNKEELRNSRVENGVLIIEAHKEKAGTRNYSSARLVTKNKGDWKYGRVEVRAKLPSGRGTWPAIWMLPTDWEYGGWPSSGEIDIMEHVGFEKDSIYGTIHTKAYNHMYGTHKDGSIAIPTAETDFHTYAINWTPDFIEYFVDDQLYFTFKNEKKSFKEWPFDKQFYLVLNIAVGGKWGGRKGIDDNIWPQRMEIDYVRVYQNSEVTEKATLD